MSDDETPSDPTGDTDRREFVGTCEEISAHDIEVAAERLGAEVAAVKAVIEIEGGGRAFLPAPDCRPPILFESHLFSRDTGGKHDHAYPNLSTPKWDRSTYGAAGAHQYDRLHEAIAIDPPTTREAALRSASWGAFQILGRNYKAAGYETVDDFVFAMCRSGGKQLDAFVTFLKTNGIAGDLRDKDWASFARKYNGPGYKQNRYDEKLAASYARHAGVATDEAGTDDHPPVLRTGNRGTWVSRLQGLLNAALDLSPPLETDGVFGPQTDAAVRRYQKAEALDVDGIVGRATWRALYTAAGRGGITSDAA